MCLSALVAAEQNGMSLGPVIFLQLHVLMKIFWGLVKAQPSSPIVGRNELICLPDICVHSGSLKHGTWISLVYCAHVHIN